MIIDSHLHFWKYNPDIHKWITEDMKVIKKDFLPHHISPVIKKNKVSTCIAIQAEKSETEINFLLDLSKHNPFIKAVVGWVDLTSKNIEQRLDILSQNKKLKGIRHIIQDEEDNFILRQDFINGISKLNKYGLTYDILIKEHILPNTIEFIGKLPNQMFVLDHIAKPNIRGRKISDWKHNIEKISKFKNLYCKISGMVTENNWNNWKTNDFFAYMDCILYNFGIDRVMFGSDWPVCLLAASYEQVLDIVLEYIKNFSTEEKNKILFKNASKFYKLDF